MLSYNNKGELGLLSSCYKTYCMPHGKMVITINNNANVTCNETGQIISFARYYKKYAHLSLVCPDIA